jgi:hypothetical protein|tara:strand:+ start:169 stop:354 length:186 start_codon:yes stop_codon:yes gene_type:complete
MADSTDKADESDDSTNDDPWHGSVFLSGEEFSYSFAFGFISIISGFFFFSGICDKAGFSGV